MRNVVEIIKPLIKAFAILLFSFFSAVFVCLRSILMVELIGLNSLSNEFGLVTMCQGLSAFIGAPIAGKHIPIILVMTHITQYICHGLLVSIRFHGKTQVGYHIIRSRGSSNWKSAKKLEIYESACPQPSFNDLFLQDPWGYGFLIPRPPS